MKKFFTFLIAFFALGLFGIQAQVCDIDTTLVEPGLYPDAEGLPCVQRGVPYDTVILIKNFNMVDFGGNIVTVNWVRIDSIKGLPSGITYECDNPTCFWLNQQSGCIRLSGTSNDPCGQYKLGIFVCADVGLQLCDVPISTLGLRFDMKVVDQDSPCFMIDTLNCLPDEAEVFGYCPCTATGIENLSSVINSIDITPNPFRSYATVNFVSTENGTYNASIINQLGQAVKADEINVTIGNNEFKINGEGLSTGVYFYRLEGQKGSISKKFVITE